MAYWPYTHNQNKAYLAIYEPAMAYWALFLKPKQGLLGHIQICKGLLGLFFTISMAVTQQYKVP